MYKCKIYKYIFPGDPSAAEDIPEPVSFIFECELPFPPFIGLRIRSNDLGCDIKKVDWDLDEEVFYCDVEHRYPDVMYEGNNFKNLIDWAIDEGWIVITWPNQYIEELGERPINK
ncbi:MAG: hypothetical protein OEY89_13520 [Gammaproteobacteria bacterium]|nr:hypothetical protein [Gammaproteobacteria bacterium]